jgi:hypothetical protein
MILHRALTDAKVGGDIFAGVSGEHEIQYLPLTRREAG